MPIEWNCSGTVACANGYLFRFDSGINVSKNRNGTEIDPCYFGSVLV